MTRMGNIKYTPESSIAMENGPFEDVFPIKHGDIPASYVIVSQRVSIETLPPC